MDINYNFWTTNADVIIAKTERTAVMELVVKFLSYFILCYMSQARIVCNIKMMQTYKDLEQHVTCTILIFSFHICLPLIYSNESKVSIRKQCIQCNTLYIACVASCTLALFDPSCYPYTLNEGGGASTYLVHSFTLHRSIKQPSVWDYLSLRLPPGLPLVLRQVPTRGMHS